MTSSRRIAFSFVLVAACGGVLLAFLPSAKGQNAAVGNGAFGNNAASPSSPSGMPGSPSPMGSSGDPLAAGGAATSTGTTSTSTGSPHLNQVVGISPVQTGTKQLIVFGGTGNETLDIQNENIYSLLRQNGVPIPNVLHPYSTAKPSFIVEKLIVLSLTGNANTSTSGAAGGGSASEAGRGGVGEAGGATQAPAGPTAAQNTISEVRRYVDAEITQGSGRSGGAHRRKLQYLRDSIALLETANTIGAAISSATGGDARGGESSGNTGGSSKIDPREILYGQVRLTARRADRYVPAPK